VLQKTFSSLLLSIVVSVASVGIYHYFFVPRPTLWNRSGDPASEARYVSMVNRLFDHRSNATFHSSTPTDFTRAAQIATPAVVNIKALVESDGGFWNGGTLSGSSGSGVMVSPDGLIVTNHHVVENSTDIKVTLADKRAYKAYVVGSDPSTDISLLQIQETGLPFLIFGNSDSVHVGEWVLAVGNPFNLESTVTAGIVSAKGRNIDILGNNGGIESFIQTDAAVNPGNSGGALVNTAGELIGINTAIITESGNYEGYSFAVPSNLAQKIVRDLKEFGEVKRAFLGVGINNVDSEIARDLGLPNAEGIYITRVNTGSAAADAGLQRGDVIISINNIKVRSTPELLEMVGRYRPGEQMLTEYWRKGEKYRVRITLKDSNNATKWLASDKYRGDELESSLGLTLRDLNREERRKTGLSGATVGSIRRNSLVAETNIQPGFIITSVNDLKVEDATAAIEAIQNAYNSLKLDGYYAEESQMYSYRFKKR
jgi:Do/DeqQ family serine protease